MSGPDAPIREIYVQPGESHLVSEPAALRTVLGSCVGITFLAPRLGVGALCHPMLPRCPEEREPRLSVCAGRRYVDFAIRDMARQLDALGVVRAEVEVKLFGGGDVLTVASGSNRPTVGKLNSDAAIRVLEEEGFTVSACRLGGNAGVHIQFSTASGEVFVRPLNLASRRPVPHSSRGGHRCGPPR